MDVLKFQIVQAKDGVQRKLTPMEIILLDKENGAIVAQIVSREADLADTTCTSYSFPVLRTYIYISGNFPIQNPWIHKSKKLQDMMGKAQQIWLCPAVQGFLLDGE